jgi:thiamine pyrophosphate-dependent acetolactate synthase large subunit-like protein
MENRTYEMTGGQDLAPGVDFAALARGAGIPNVERIETLDEFEERVPGLLTEPGPHFVALPVTNAEPLPPVSHTDHAGRVTRLREGLGLA